MNGTLSAPRGRSSERLAAFGDDARMQEPDRLTALRRFWEGWSRGSVPDIVDLLHPEVRWWSAVLERDFSGHDDVVSWLEGLRREWKSLTVTLERAEVAGDDRAVAYGTVRAFGYGGDQQLDTPMIWIAEFRDGLIVRGHIFTDPEQARRHLEATP
jgi:ketosteroid isomerase-like protein